MSIFGRQNTSNAYVLPTIEGYGCEDLGHMHIITEAFDDQLDIIRSIHALDTLEIQGKREIASLEESGASAYVIQEKIDKCESVYEAWYGDAWAKIKSFFINLGKKIKAFYDSIIRWFAGHFMVAKKYVEKYGKAIEKLSAEGKLKGYKIKTFDNQEILEKESHTVEGVFNIVHEFAGTEAPFNTTGTNEAKIKASTENKEDLDKALRGHLLKTSEKLSHENYVDELYKKFRGGNAKSTEDKVEKELSASTVIAYLKDDKPLKAAGKARDNMSKVFSDQISEIERLSSHLSDTSKEGEETYKTGKYEGEEGKQEKTSSTWAHSKEHGKTESGGEARTVLIETARLQVHIFNTGKTEALAFVNAWRNAIEEKISDYMKYCRGAYSYKEEK